MKIELAISFLVGMPDKKIVQIWELRQITHFVQIPTARLKNRIEQLCEQYGIDFIETEESYSSKTSFLDNDVLPTIGAKPVRASVSEGEGWMSSGTRIKRGLFKASTGIKINADCNGAANIIRKVAMMVKFNLAGIIDTPHG